MKNSHFGKKKPATDLKMKIYNESLSRKKYIYILEKKEKANLVIAIEKKSRHTIGWSKEKKTSMQKVLNTK